MVVLMLLILPVTSLIVRKPRAQRGRPRGAVPLGCASPGFLRAVPEPVDGVGRSLVCSIPSHPRGKEAAEAGEVRA